MTTINSECHSLTHTAKVAIDAMKKEGLQEESVSAEKKWSAGKQFCDQRSSKISRHLNALINAANWDIEHNWFK